MESTDAHDQERLPVTDGEVSDMVDPAVIAGENKP
jgi:hypothetical protein